MTNSTRRLFVATLAILMSSCTIAKISAKASRPVLLNQPTEAFDIIQHVQLEKPIRFDNTNTFELDDVIAEALQQTQADAIINVRVEIKTTPVDYILNAVTLNIANARTAVVEGDAIKYKR